MKKIILNFQELGVKEVLTREQLRNVLGGQEIGTSSGKCKDFQPCTTYDFGDGRCGANRDGICSCFRPGGGYIVETADCSNWP